MWHETGRENRFRQKGYFIAFWDLNFYLQGYKQFQSVGQLLTDPDDSWCPLM
jgi:hypothetical protein